MSKSTKRNLQPQSSVYTYFGEGAPPLFAILADELANLLDAPPRWGRSISHPTGRPEDPPRGLEAAMHRFTGAGRNAVVE